MFLTPFLISEFVLDFCGKNVENLAFWQKVKQKITQNKKIGRKSRKNLDNCPLLCYSDREVEWLL